ncbi:MAG TPA: hypothetical protein VKP30_05530 [Polyangiaceae bacterium]|nr:hypothetical protein [Polyangiaceae bacterium]
MPQYCRHHTRGAASVEAVVALPVFVILFVAMFFIRDLAGARLRADQEVRRCSWEYALNYNCEAPPPGCNGVVGNSHYGSLLPTGIDDAIRSVGEGSNPKGSNPVSSEDLARVKHVLENFVAEFLAEAISRRFEAEKLIERERPAMFGAGKSVVRGKYNLACNVRHQDQHDVITSVWNQFKP